MEQENVVELFAEKVHELWTDWAEKAINNCSVLPTGELVISSNLIDLWQTVMVSPYHTLDKSNKDLARHEAQGFIEVLNNIPHCDFNDTQLLMILNGLREASINFSGASTSQRYTQLCEKLEEVYYNAPENSKFVLLLTEAL